MAEREMMLVRIRPVRRARAPKVARYMFEGQRYDAARGWYEVEPALAARLKDLRQDHYDPESSLVFDVCTRDEALRLEQSEAQVAERAPAGSPNVVRGGRRARPDGAFTSRELEKARIGERARFERAPEPESEPESDEPEEDLWPLAKEPDEEVDEARVAADQAAAAQAAPPGEVSVGRRRHRK